MQCRSNTRMCALVFLWQICHCVALALTMLWGMTCSDFIISSKGGFLQFWISEGFILATVFWLIWWFIHSAYSISWCEGTSFCLRLLFLRTPVSVSVTPLFSLRYVNICLIQWLCFPFKLIHRTRGEWLFVHNTWQQIAIPNCGVHHWWTWVDPKQKMQMLI